MRKPMNNDGTVMHLSGEIISDEYAWLYGWFGIDCTTPGQINEALRNAAGRPITVKVDSPGGMISAGAAMYEAMMDYAGQVTFEITTAHSAASFVTMASAKAGNVSKISPLGLMGIHNAQGGAEGDYHDMDQAAQHLRAGTQAVVNAYRLKTGMPEEQLRELMDNVTMFSAQEALNMGMVDEIMHQDGENKLEFSEEQLTAVKNRMGAMMNTFSIPSKLALKKMQAVLKPDQPGDTPDKDDVYKQQKALLEIERCKY